MNQKQNNQMRVIAIHGLIESAKAAIAAGDVDSAEALVNAVHTLNKYLRLNIEVGF